MFSFAYSVNFIHSKIIFLNAFSFSHYLEEPQHLIVRRNKASGYLEMHRYVEKIVLWRTCLGQRLSAEGYLFADHKPAVPLARKMV